MFAMGTACAAASPPSGRAASSTSSCRANNPAAGQPEGPDGLPLGLPRPCSTEWLGDEDSQSLLGGPAIDALVRGDGYDGCPQLFK